jgi:Flp pilus assembly pilin Flp
MKTLLSRLVREEKGQDVIEYALLAAAISVVAIPTVPSIGSAVNNAYVNVNTQVVKLPGNGS